MKKSGFWIAALLLILLVSFQTAKPVDKPVTVTFTGSQWSGKLDTLVYINNVIGKSLSVDQAEQLKGYMQSVISGMAVQVQHQLNDTVPAATKPKK